VTTAASKESKRKPWWLVAVAVLAIGGIVAASVAMTAEDEDSTASESGSIGDPEIRQASWKFEFQRAPGPRLSKKQRAAASTQRTKLKAMTQDVFDALFLSPEKQTKALKVNFTAPARKSYERAGAGVPKSADDVRIRWRSAQIAIDRNVRATINVKVRARGQTNSGAFATEHHSVLYAARGKDGWKVFGFEVDQQPLKKNKGPDKKTNKKTQPKDKPSKNTKNKTNEKGKKRSGGENRGSDRS
jgi:hypothetical protein